MGRIVENGSMYFGILPFRMSNDTFDQWYEVSFYFIIFHLMATREGGYVVVMLTEYILAISPVSILFAKETITVFLVEIGHMVKLTGFHRLIGLMYFRGDGV